MNTVVSKIMSAQSMTGSFNTSAVNVDRASLVSMQFNWSGGGTPVGTLKLQESNDAVNWFDIAGATGGSVSGNSGSLLLQGTAMNIRTAFMRGVYTVTSGTAVMDVILVAKGGT